MGEQVVRPGPAGSRGTATLGQQDPTTCDEAVLRARRGSSLKKLKFCCKTKPVLQSCCCSQGSTQGQSSSLGTSAPWPGPACPVLTSVSKANAADAPPPPP